MAHDHDPRSIRDDGDDIADAFRKRIDKATPVIDDIDDIDDVNSPRDPASGLPTGKSDDGDGHGYHSLPEVDDEVITARSGPQHVLGAVQKRAPGAAGERFMDYVDDVAGDRLVDDGAGDVDAQMTYDDIEFDVVAEQPSMPQEIEMIVQDDVEVDGLAD